MQKISAYLVLLTLLSSMTAVADSQTSTVDGYIPFSSGGKEILIFKLKNNVVADVGGCNTTGRFAISEDNPRYRATFSAIIAAFHAQTTIKVKYLPGCDAWGNSADVNLVCVGDINC